MTDTCKVSDIPPVLLAVAQLELPQAQIAARIRGLFDVAYTWLEAAPVRQVGHNYAIYEKGQTSELLLRAGFPVSEPFASTDEVTCYELPGGRVAHAVHTGPYGEMRRTYQLLEAWCRREALPLSGQSWEVYGDWNNDPARLQTGIFFRLRVA